MGVVANKYADKIHKSRLETPLPSVSASQIKPEKMLRLAIGSVGVSLKKPLFVFAYIRF